MMRLDPYTDMCSMSDAALRAALAEGDARSRADATGPRRCVVAIESLR